MNDSTEQYQDLDNENCEGYESPVDPEVLSNDSLPSNGTDKGNKQSDLVGYRYKGPFTPKLLQEYDQLKPGFSSQYLDNLLEEPRHRRRLENQEFELLKEQAQQNAQFLKRQSRRANWGLFAGVFSVVLVVSLCAYMVSQKATREAAWIAATILPSLAGVFVVGTLKNKKEEENNQDLEIGKGA